MTTLKNLREEIELGSLSFNKMTSLHLQFSKLYVAFKGDITVDADKILSI